MVYTVKVNQAQKIIFFDGHCGLCNQFVNIIFSKDSSHQFHFASLQGQTASLLLHSQPVLDTIIYWKQGKTFIKSQAVLEILRDLGGIYSIFSIFYIFPRFLLDRVYDFIAARRYSWFGHQSECRLPTPSERPYFLD